MQQMNSGNSTSFQANHLALRPDLIDAISTVIAIGQAHLDDIASGRCEGIYELADNHDLTRKQWAIHTVNELLELLAKQVTAQPSSATLARFTNHYECPSCGIRWTDLWDSMCDDDCPKCGNRNISPLESIDSHLGEILCTMPR